MVVNTKSMELSGLTQMQSKDTLISVGNLSFHTTNPIKYEFFQKINAFVQELLIVER